jgi:hypothetical protein
MVAIPAGVAPPEPRALDDLARRARTKRVVLIEGDSWMNFPLPFAVGLDRAMHDHHGYDTRLHFARAGATLLGMVYGDRRRDLGDVLDNLRRVKPRVMLFSGGGNDVVGPEFANYLNYKVSGKPALREDFMEMQFEAMFLPAYRHLITKVLEASPDTKIFVHGYAHAFASGKVVDVAFFDELGIIRIGPWMRPSIEDRGWTKEEGREVVIDLINRFNAMLAGLHNEFRGHFFHVDFRLLVKKEADWRDELHLTNGAWKRCAAKLNEVIEDNVSGW